MAIATCSPDLSRASAHVSLRDAPNEGCLFPHFTVTFFPHHLLYPTGAHPGARACVLISSCAQGSGLSVWKAKKLPLLSLSLTLNYLCSDSALRRVSRLHSAPAAQAPPEGSSWGDVLGWGKLSRHPVLSGLACDGNKRPQSQLYSVPPSPGYHQHLFTPPPQAQHRNTQDSQFCCHESIFWVLVYAIPLLDCFSPRTFY